MFKDEKGNVIITTPIITIAMFFIICITIVASIEIIKPFVVYEKISSIALKYIFIMEEYGCLNDIERNNLINELEDKGLDRSKLIISGDTVRRDYGEIIKLRIEYQYLTKLYSTIDNFKLDKKELEIPIVIEKTSFSKI